MQRNKSCGRCFIIAGVILILLAAILVAWNLYQDSNGGKSAASVLKELNNEITADDSDNDLPNESFDDTYSENESVIELDGKKYIGIISVPKISLELPVMNQWSYANLDISPCRYMGSVAEKNLIIAAHNYTSFFDRIDELNSGDEIIFTECSGRVHKYSVSMTELINGGDVSGMESNSDDWDLTLFTCTWSGWSRVTVRAVEA